MTRFDWQTICPGNDQKRWIAGTELERAYVPGTASRLCVYTVRRYDADRNADVSYIVRDADKISDAEVREGKRPPIIGTFATLDELEAAIERAKVKKPEAFAFD